LITATRFVLVTGLRLIFPFKPEIRRGLGISAAQFDQVVALSSAAGLIGPWLAPLSERYGRRRMLAGMLLLFSIGSGLAAFAPGVGGFALALLLMTLAKVVYDPIMQAYLGDSVPYSQRGRALAVTELAWSMALLVGSPVAGWLIGRIGWNAPFIALAALGLGSALLLTTRLPEAPRDPSRAPATLQTIFRLLYQQPTALWLAVATLIAMAANQLLFISYAEWMEQQFGLSLGQLGLTAVVIGSAELVGEGIVGWRSDRFGKRRLVLLAGSLNALAYAAMPLAGSSLIGALVALFAIFALFEITLVGLVPIFSELTPQARTAGLLAFSIALPMGRLIGALLAQPVQALGGMAATGLFAALLMGGAVVMMGRAAVDN
jgi:predicted MFS family arabinose efflux permease